MNAILLARMQFAFTVGFHFIFPPTTLGISLMVLWLESRFLKSGNTLYKELSSLLVKILGLVFVLGTATGIVMEFSFGNNWAAYARMVGDVFGAPLAAEGVFAFFMESIFLGILVFGRSRVSPKTYWWSAFFVFFGSHLSGLWIIIANSWMQTPAGYVLQNGKAVLTNFWQAAFNPSTLIRFIHTIVAGWITAMLLLLAIAAWYLRRNRALAHAKALFIQSFAILALAACMQLPLGHLHSVQVAVTQPVKMAAFEALWKTQANAPLSLFALPDPGQEKNHLFIGIPNALSLLVYGNSSATVPGLDQFSKNERPPVLISFVSYHIMILLGMYFIAMGALGGYLLLTKKIWQSRFFLTAVMFSAPLGYIACETGWIAAEVGRQPWAVYGILKTAHAVSPLVSSGQILFSLSCFVAIYACIAIVAWRAFKKIIARGPESSVAQGY